MRPVFSFLFFFAVASCSDGTSFVVVDVGSGTSLTITSLDVTVTNAGDQAHLAITHGASFTIPPSQSFSVEFKTGRVGDVTVDVKALGASGEIAHASGTTSINAGGTATLSIMLTPTMGTDGGGTVDMTTSPDLTMPPDLGPPLPVLTSVSPGLGPTMGGTKVALGGMNFKQGAKVTIAGLDAGAVRMADNLITATVPAKPGAFGKVPVVVANPDGTSATRSDLFSYYASTFSVGQPTNIGTDTNPEWVAPGDWSGDGKIDLAIAQHGGNDLGILIGKGDGTFQPPVNYMVGGVSPKSVAVGDFNGDGKVDLATANFDSANVGVFIGKGDGTFAAVLNYPTGSGVAEPQTIQTADFNGDKNLDLITSNYGNGTVSILTGSGNGTFQPPVNFTVGAKPIYVVVADFNGDGIPDAATANYSDNTVSVRLGKGDGTLLAAATYTVGVNPKALAVGDFNADQSLDLIVATYTDNSVSLLAGKGDGTFQANAVIPAGAGTGPFGLNTGDLNGDGKLDLAIADWGGSGVSVRLGNGNGTFFNPMFYAAQSSTSYPGIADLNGDGKPDLAVVSFGGGLSIFLNTSQ